MSQLPSKLTSEDIAWVAGVVDTLGIVRVRRVGGSDLPGVFIHTPHLRLLRQMGELTGTKVTVVERKYSRVGCSEHCVEQHLHVESTSGRWSLTGARARVMLEATLPHLRVQDREVREMLEMTESAPYRRSTVEKMASLGWPVSEELAPGHSPN